MDRVCTPGLCDGLLGIDVVASGSLLRSSSDSAGMLLFDTTAGFPAMPSVKGAQLMPMALGLLAVVLTAEAIGTAFHDKY